tara:strand:- start:169 stop:1275 length:1107 start_codon:yes stop_codon:yes gene_type:complete
MAITRITTANAIPDSSVNNVKISNIVQSKNIVINGDMSIAQRGTSATGITSQSYYTADRWETRYSSGGTWTQTQSTDVPSGQGFATSLKMDCTTAQASPSELSIRQRLEGQNLQYLKYGTSSAQSLTYSFWVKSNKTGTYIVEIDAAGNSRQISKSYTISSANTWEKKTITFPGDTSSALANSNSNIMSVRWWLAAGSSWSSGTLNTSWNSITNANRAVGQVNLGDSTSNEWYVTGLQLEAGTTASEFEFLPVDVNLGRCQRYCFSEPAGDANHVIMNGFYPNTSLFIGIKHLPVPMRAEPSITTSGSWQTASTTDKTATSFTITDSAVNNLTSVQFRANVSSVIAGDGANFRNAGDATAKFILSSEL